MPTAKRFTSATGEPVADNTNIMTSGPRGPALLQDCWMIAYSAVSGSSSPRARATPVP
jgi:catalase